MGVRGQALLSDKEITERFYETVGRDGRGKMTPEVRRNLCNRGILVNGTRGARGAREALGLPEPINARYAWEDFLRAVRSKEAYPPRKVRRFMSGDETVTMPSFTEFWKDNRGVCRYVRRTWGPKQTENRGNLRERTGMYKAMEIIYPGFYIEWQRGGNPASEINLERTRAQLLKRYYSGKDIHRSLLDSSDEKEKELGKAVMTISRALGRKSKEKPKGFSETVRIITGLSAQDTKISKYGQKQNADILEEIVRVVLGWGLVTHMRWSAFLPRKELYSGGEDTRFSYDGTRSRADGRFDGNCALEVKSGQQEFSATETQDVIDRYAPGNNLWAKAEGPNRRIERSLVVFHHRDHLCKKATRKLKSHGIETMGYDQFHKLLERVLSRIESQYPEVLKTIEPRMQDLGSLVRLHEEAAHHPHLLMRKGNRDRRLQILYFLRGLRIKAEETSDES